MKVIDILDYVIRKHKCAFTFYIDHGPDSNDRNSINWTYVNGQISSNGEDNFTYFLRKGVYKLDSEIHVILGYGLDEGVKVQPLGKYIEEQPEVKSVSEDLEPLQYIEFDPCVTRMKYGNWEEAYNYDTKFLALVMNRIILEIEKMKEDK